MARKMKVRTRTQEGQVELLILINHPMETGLRTDKKTKKKIPSHFIQNLTVTKDGKSLVEADAGIGISQNPLFGFRLKNTKAGDKLQISWSDNRGESGSMEKVVDL